MKTCVESSAFSLYTKFGPLDPNITCVEFQTTLPPKKKEDQRVLYVETLKAL